MVRHILTALQATQLWESEELKNKDFTLIGTIRIGGLRSFLILVIEIYRSISRTRKEKLNSIAVITSNNNCTTKEIKS